MTPEAKYIDGRCYITAFKDTKTYEENMRNMLSLYSDLVDAGIVPGRMFESCCDGKPERTFVPHVSPQDIPALLAIGMKYAQDSIIVDGNLLKCATGAIIAMFTTAQVYETVPESPYWTRFARREYVVLS